MDVTTITVDQFKARFTRDFPYLSSITYDPTKLYNTGDEVYYPTTELFYTAAKDGVRAVAPDLVQDPPVWQKAVDSLDNYVQDQDITNAYAEAQVMFNPALFGSDAQVTLGYLYLAAHFLVNDLKAGFGGISAAAFFPVQSRSAGSVSESYGIPAGYAENPILAALMGSAYGSRYLQMVLPNLIGNMAALPADANP